MQMNSEYLGDAVHPWHHNIWPTLLAQLIDLESYVPDL